MVYTNGKPLTITRWLSGQPSNATSETDDCVAIRITCASATAAGVPSSCTHGWFATSCYRALTSLCVQGEQLISTLITCHPVPTIPMAATKDHHASLMNMPLYKLTYLISMILSGRVYCERLLLISKLTKTGETSICEKYESSLDVHDSILYHTFVESMGRACRFNISLDLRGWNNPQGVTNHEPSREFPLGHERTSCQCSGHTIWQGLRAIHGKQECRQWQHKLLDARLKLHGCSTFCVST